MRILKRFLTTDRNGRVVSGKTERLTDGPGGTHLTERRVAVRCPSCTRWLTDVSEYRGRCDYCRRRVCCVHCDAKCAACSRRLCGDCRRGFIGRVRATVCPICLVRLRRRQLAEDRLMVQQIAFQRSMARRREWTRIQALRFQAAREQARGRLAVVREINRIKLALARMVNGRRRIR